jgi:hypothetical protein
MFLFLAAFAIFNTALLRSLLNHSHPINQKLLVYDLIVNVRSAYYFLAALGRFAPYLERR